jgi:ribosomal protein S12 methylthiotransferase
MDIQQNISHDLNNRFIGRNLRVLVDREEADCFAGRTEFDSPEVDGEVLIEKSEGIRVGDFLEVEITGATEFDLYGKPVRS